MDAAARDPRTNTDPARRISALVRAVVERAAPDELPMVDGLAVAEDDVIVARLTRRPPRDERLGFGVDDVAALVTPVLFIVLDQAVRKIVDGSLDGAGHRLRRLVRRRLVRRRGPTPVVELSPQEIAEITARVTAVARERGVPEDKVERVAEAVTEVLADPPDAGEAPDQDDRDDRDDRSDGDATPP